MKRKVLSFFLSFMCILSCFLPMQIYADYSTNTTPMQYSSEIQEDITITPPFQESDFNSYVSTMQEQYLKVVEFEDPLSPFDTVCYSQGYEILNDNDPYNKLYFLFVNNECKGDLVVTYANGEFASSFCTKEIPEITDALEENSAFSLCSYEDTLLLCSSEDIKPISGVMCGEDLPYNTSEELSTSCGYTNNCAAISISDPIDVDISETRASTNLYGSTLTSTYGILRVPLVDNENDENGNGLCWCASVASIAAYRLQRAAQGARELYDILEEQNLITPSGNPTFIKLAFEHYGLSYNYYETGLNYDQVVVALNSQRPIYASLTNGTTSHAVVICGYQNVQGGYRYYTLMDPNRTSFVTVLVSSTSTDFTYAAGRVTYTDWRRTFY